MACQDPSLALLKQFGYNVFRYPRPDAAPLDLLTRSGKDLSEMAKLLRQRVLTLSACG